MKTFLIGLLLSLPAFAQFDVFPDSPLDSSMGNAAGGTASQMGATPESEDIQKEEAPLEGEEDLDGVEVSDEEFNKNWDQESLNLTPDLD